ncbi:hypothetical protein Golomagni_05864 [Golovinomyces magnicellulatus]|nr:hypothetical protein Golomagni_05864 [Golovinomyces magnicellulatus]
MDAESEDLRRKRESFDRMHKLIQYEGVDDELDAQEQRLRTRHSRFFHGQQPQNPPPKPSTSKSALETPRRDAQPEHENIIKATQSAVRERKRAASAQDAIVVDDEVIGETPTSTHAAKNIKQSALARVSGKRRLLDETPRPLPSSLLMAGKKTKKEPSFKMRPETEQIFKGLSFYFVPDNAIAPARRLRINKAREFGAIWTRTITEATHVVVDKSITYDDLQGTLLGSVKENVKVVNEDYPIDCVQFRALLETDQVKYRLVGQPSRRTEVAETEQPSPQSSQVSVVSLQLKPPQRDATKWDHVPPRGTPDRSGGQSTPATVDSQPIELDKGGPAVDTTVEEAEKSEAAASTSVEQTTNSGGKDELSAFISMMQEFKDLPLDKDDEEDGHTEAGSTVAENSEESERDESPQKKRVATSYKRAAKPVLNVEDRFACHRAGEKNLQSENPNSRTVEILQKMLDYYLRVNDQWRSMAYRKAISVLKRQQTKISTEEEALQLPGIGGRLAQKIEEIVSTNSLKRLEYAEMDESDAVLQLFLGIYGPK